MSSLGYQSIYRTIQSSGSWVCERVFAPDEPATWESARHEKSYESDRPLGEFPVIAVSMAYEIELTGLLLLLHGAGIEPLREARRADDPLVILGGPLTFSNPLPCSPFVDAIVMGEADTLIYQVLSAVFDAETRNAQLQALAQIPHVFVPSIHGQALPALGKCENDLLPAWSPIQTPYTELRDMFLIEAVRGCSRGCGYCVMRRSTNGGMRIVPQDRLLSLVPDHVKRVGLVGASVSDHPKIVDIVSKLAEAGKDVGLSSLRPDRLSRDFVFALKKAGYRTLTTALDGASERVRKIIDRRTTEQHIVRAAQFAKEAKIDRLKLYLMLGVPQETDEDIEECARFLRELSTILPVSLGVSPFCAKRNTPLDRQPFAGLSVVGERLTLLRQRVKGKVDIRSASPRWAWVEHVLAQGSCAEGVAALEAVQQGGRFSHFRRSFEALGHRCDATRLPIVPISPVGLL